MKYLHLPRLSSPQSHGVVPSRSPESSKVSGSAGNMHLRFALNSYLCVPGYSVTLSAALAMQEVEISTSADGQNFFVVVPWRPTAGTGGNLGRIIILLD